jgi:predicted nucleic acid-binding Zn ribbon protein
MSSEIDKHIGEVFGIYVIDSLSYEKTKNGQKLYNAVCQVCGHVRIATHSELKRKPVQQCTHNRGYKKKFCLHCGKEIPISNQSAKHHNSKKFCSRSCAASYNNRGICRNPKKDPMTNKCLLCDKQIRQDQKYCSVLCQRTYEYKEYIRKWKAGEISGLIGDNWIEVSGYIRRYIFEKYNHKCAECGWAQINPYTGKLPLEVEHIDGDATNNKEENLTLLCPNCHSLTPTYRGANKGNGKRDIKWVARKGSTNVEEDN